MPKMQTLLLIFFIIVTVSFAGENDSQNLTSKVKSEVDFSGYAENELDSLSYYCMGRGFDTFNGYSKIEEKLYKVDIHPKTPKEGIMTGYAILYGHYVKPPYKFEIVNDTILYLNGIQIDPPVKNKVKEIANAWCSKRAHENLEREGFTPYIEHEDFLSKETRSIYEKLMPKKGQKGVIDSITKLLKDDTLLHEFHIMPLDDGGLAIDIVSKRPDGKIGGGFVINIQPPDSYKEPFTRPKDEAERIRWRREYLVNIMKSNEENLKRGGTQYDGSGRYGAYWALTTHQIMSDPSLVLFMKVERLKKLDPTTLLYKEMIYNYSQEEYQEVEKREQK